MHSLHFSITTGFDTTVEEVKEKLRANPRVAMTLKNSANTVFSIWSGAWTLWPNPEPDRYLREDLRGAG